MNLIKRYIKLKKQVKNSNSYELLSTYDMPGTVDSVLHVLIH